MVEPTLTEIRLQQSLIPSLREASIPEISSQQTFRGGQSIVPRVQIQTRDQVELPPIRAQVRQDGTIAGQVREDRGFVGRARDLFSGSFRESLIPFSAIERKVFREKVAPPVGQFLISDTKIPVIKDFGLEARRKPFLRVETVSIREVTGKIKQDPDVPFLIKGAAFVVEEVAGTPLKLGITAATIGAFSLAPPAVRLGGTLVQTGLGGRLFFTGETEAEKAGGLIFAGAGAFGTAVETFPFIRGATARLSPRFKSIRREEIDIGGVKVDSKFISDLAFDGGRGQIGLIPEGIGRGQGEFAPGAGALERGGFGFKPSEQIKGFAGRDLRLTTSQRGLTPEGGEFKADPSISDLGFFFTPADPVTGIPQTRISRLGLQDFFKRPTGEISFALAGGGRPQIIVTEPTPIIASGRTGGIGTARVTPKGSTELEVTSLSNIQIVKQLGVTTLKGQKVDIILGRLTDKPITGSGGFRGGRIGEVIPSTRPSATIPIPSLAGGTFGISRITGRLSGTPSIKTGGISSRQISSFPTIDIGSPQLQITGRPTSGLPPTGGLSIPISSQITTPGIPSLGLPDVIRPESTRGRRRKGERKKKIKKPIKKVKKRRRRIRPSFTGIITAGGIRSPLVGIEFEEPAFATTIAGRDIGVSPFALRGTRTGLAPRRR